ncbi:MAG TPA: twin-arginine translocase TatA/TatE family subunit [Candidatus Baltobacteraceae bacterium]|nr:twin-arginine translocase TatA/TatE family subunit [Candidatus Baltobacteraceae bacterium]
MFGNPMEIAVLVGAAVLLFGGGKIREVARGLGAAKKEFTIGQAEADIAAERLRSEARATAEARIAAESAAAPAVAGGTPPQPPAQQS